VRLPNRSPKPHLQESKPSDLVVGAGCHAIFAVFQKSIVENAPVKHGVTRREWDALGVLDYTHDGPGIADGTLIEEIVPARMAMIVER